MSIHSTLFMASIVVLGIAACGRTRTAHTRVAGPAGSLYVDDGGKQKSDELPVVFLHSFAGDSSHWAAQLAHLRKTRRAVALNLRAHGESEAPRDGKHSIAVMAKDLDAVVNALKLDHFVLVGHSMGGAIAVIYAGEHPERVAGLVLMGTPGKAPPEMAEKVMASLYSEDRDKVMDGYWKKLLHNATPHTEEVVEVGRHKMSSDRSLSFIQAVFDYDPLPALKRYDGPVLAITADGDDQPGALHKAAPMTVKTIEGTSHWVQLDKPDEVNEILDEFLAGLQAGS